VSDRNGRLKAELKPCAWRILTAIEGRFHCRHPQVHAEQNIVSPQVCRCCSFDNAPPGRWQIDAESSASLRTNSGDAWCWSVGITTAPRAGETLEQCVESLRAAGWQTARIFAEPGAELPASCRHFATTCRDERLGAFPNWYLGLAELVMRQPSADAYLMVQDDAVLARGARAYLEQWLWPAATVGVVSLYCPSHYSQGRATGMHVITEGWLSWGALAYAFPGAAARQILLHPSALEHRRRGPHGGLRNVDSVVGAWCVETALPYYVHVPSLVQHIGHTSTLYPDASAAGKRVASDFVADIQHLTPSALSSVNPEQAKA
jgi:hypothetical protein